MPECRRCGEEILVMHTHRKESEGPIPVQVNQKPTMMYVPVDALGRPSPESEFVKGLECYQQHWQTCRERSKTMGIKTLPLSGQTHQAPTEKPKDAT